jgi:hypothetical protein
LKILKGNIQDSWIGLNGPFDLIMLFNVIYYFSNEERFPLLRRLRALLSPNGVLAVVMHCKSNGKDLGAANLNMVNCSLKGLTPLPDLEKLTDLLKRSGFGQVTSQRLLPVSTFYGLVAHGT